MEPTDIEQLFWQEASNPQLYKNHLHPQGFVLLPYGEGLFSQEEVMALIKEHGAAWDKYHWLEVREIALSDAMRILLYTVEALRGDQLYKAAVSSVYGLVEDQWMLITHQQTPLPEDEHEHNEH